MSTTAQEIIGSRPVPAALAIDVLGESTNASRQERVAARERTSAWASRFAAGHPGDELARELRLVAMELVERGEVWTAALVREAAGRLA